MKLPRRYLAEHQGANPKLFSRIMRSHLIPAGTDSAVWQRGIAPAFKRFQDERLSLICREFERAAGIKLFFRK
jgi:hypothetical protein